MVMNIKRIPRLEFLQNRQQWRDAVAKYKRPNDIVCDPGNAIVCDRCNCDALWPDDTVLIVDDYALCTTCGNGQYTQPVVKNEG